MQRPIPRRQSCVKQRATPRQWRGVFLLVLSLIVAGTLIFSATWAWSWMQKPTSFPIKQIHIQGQLTHETPQQIQKIVQKKLTGGFFSLNLLSIKQAILTQPWIQQVSFRRVWPSTLTLRITEQQAIARFGKKGVLNSDGQVFYPNEKTIPANLPRLECAENQLQGLLNFYRSADLLARLLNLSVIAITENAENSLNLILSNQIKVILGRDEALTRFKRFVAIYPKITPLSNRPIISVDLRYPNGVSVAYQY